MLFHHIILRSVLFNLIFLLLVQRQRNSFKRQRNFLFKMLLIVTVDKEKPFNPHHPNHPHLPPSPPLRPSYLLVLCACPHCATAAPATRARNDEGLFREAATTRVRSKAGVRRTPCFGSKAQRSEPWRKAPPRPATSRKQRAIKSVRDNRLVQSRKLLPQRKNVLVPIPLRPEPGKRLNKRRDDAPPLQPGCVMNDA